MKVSKAGLDLIKKYEGFLSYPYLDAVGVPTIGYGNTYYPNGVKVSMKDPHITEELGEELLQIIVDRFEKGVLKLAQVSLTQNEFDALVSFAYNLGLGALGKSTLLAKINANKKDPTIPNEFTKWTKAGGRHLRGLAKRRIEEALIFYIGHP